METSVVIVHYKRKANLHNTLMGLKLQRVRPNEVIVIDFDKDLQLERDYGFDLKIVIYDDSWRHLPVAAARNLGAAESRTENLIFLDVDCIPNQNFIGDLVKTDIPEDALVMATPYYLLGSIQNNWTYEELNRLSIPHHSRPTVSRLTLEKNYFLFWSLCFFQTKATFDLLGGFDERYTGYAIEDTDFALKAKQNEIPFYLHPSLVFHQQHPVYKPPINHLLALTANCNKFYEKWQLWPVPDALSAFKEMGLISWNLHKNRAIEIINKPTPEEIEDCRLENVPYR